MSESKPVQKTPAWLLVADRYLAEIAEAERLEALAAAVGTCRTGRTRRPALIASWPNHPRHVGSTLIVQARARARARDLNSRPAVH